MGEVIRINRRKRAGPRWRMPRPGYHYLEIRDRTPGQGEAIAFRSGWRIVAVITRGEDGWWWYWIASDLSIAELRSEQAGRTLATLYEIKSLVREAIQ